MQQTERVAILRKLREALERQRHRFHRYLHLLESQGSSIRAGDTDALRLHVQVERHVMKDLETMQRVISPLQDLYATAYPGSDPAISELQGSLERVQSQVLTRNAENQQLLGKRMEDLRLELSAIRRRSTAASPFAALGTPTAIDVTA